MLLNLRVAVLAAFASSAAPSDPAPQKFVIPQHGTLILSVPDGWRVSTNPIEEPPALTIVMRPATGDGFSFQISSVWLDPRRPGGGSPPSPADLRERVQTAAERMLPKALKKKRRSSS
jgi:hypothetical protein